MSEESGKEAGDKAPQTQYLPPIAHVRVNGEVTKALTDCGATHRFIGGALVKKRGLEMITILDPYYFEGATGEQSMAGKVVEDPRLQVLTWTGTHPLIVAGRNQEVILGTDFLMTTGRNCLLGRGDYSFEKMQPPDNPRTEREWQLTSDPMTR